MGDSITGWHFAGKNLRDGTPLPAAGVTLPEIHDPQPCIRGYHGSVRAIDALIYAPGSYAARVWLHGTVIAHGTPVDKYCGSLRTGLSNYVDVSDALRSFARWCALDVADLWDMPAVVRQFLETGDETIRDSALRAAVSAVRAARAASDARAASAASATWAARAARAASDANAARAAKAVRTVSGVSAARAARAASDAACIAARAASDAIDARAAWTAVWTAVWTAARATSDAAGATLDRQNEQLERVLLDAI